MSAGLGLALNSTCDVSEPGIPVSEENDGSSGRPSAGRDRVRSPDVGGVGRSPATTNSRVCSVDSVGPPATAAVSPQTGHVSGPPAGPAGAQVWPREQRQTLTMPG